MNNNTKLEEGMFNRDIEHAKKIQNAIFILLQKRSEYLNAKAEKNKGKYEYNIDKETLLDFKYEKFVLKPSFVATGSDFHGDYVSLYGFLVQIGYLIPVKDNFLVCFISATEKKDGKDEEYKFGYKILSQKDLDDIKQRKDILAIMPGFEINIDFGGKIKLLGDYIDRGCESLMCLLLLNYLTQKEKKRIENKIQTKKLLYVHYGNHESTCPGGLYRANPDKNKSDDNQKKMEDLAKCLINRMRKEKQMIFSSLEMINGVPFSFSHTAMCRLHIYKILGIIKTLYKIAEFETITVARNYSN